MPGAEGSLEPGGGSLPLGLQYKRFQQVKNGPMTTGCRPGEQLSGDLRQGGLQASLQGQEGCLGGLASRKTRGKGKGDKTRKLNFQLKELYIQGQESRGRQAALTGQETV